MNFGMIKPCVDCPFLKEGAIELHPKRLEGIIKSLGDDMTHFLRHKTAHNSKTGGDWGDDGTY